MKIQDIFEICVRETKKKWLKLCYKDQISYNGILKFRTGFKVNIAEKGKISFGNRVFFNNYCSVNCMKEIVIGDYCIFGENVKIYDHNHIYSDLELPIADQGFKAGKVLIGENSWIGSNCVILQGVTIGRRCVIGAGCVIYKEIPDDSIVLCNQELIIKKRNE